jgi:Glycosyl transferases group 1
MKRVLLSCWMTVHDRFRTGALENNRFYIRSCVITPCRLIRQYGLWFLITFILRKFRQRYLTQRIRRLYFGASKQRHKLNGRHDERSFIDEIVSYGLREVSNAKARYAGIYAHRKDLRVLFNMPEEQGGAQYYYFLDLAESLAHMGIEVYRHTLSADGLDHVLSTFRPSALLASDSPFGGGLSRSESASVWRYKKEHGLARLYVPHYPSPLRARKPSPADRQRMTMHRRGELADAFFGYFEEVFWNVLFEPWKDTGLQYVPIPFAANLCRHYPVPAVREFDWGIATSNGDLGARAALTVRYMGRILKKYSGVIAGHGWGHGIDPVPPGLIAPFFSRVRVSPNIAAESNVRYPIDCGAKVHELSAIGVFQLVTETQALRKYYSHIEIVGFRTPAEFDALFEYFVDKPELRQTFVLSGMARTFAENTYFHRCTRLIEVLDKHRECF